MMPTLNSALHQKWMSEKWLYSNKVGAYTLIYSFRSYNRFSNWIGANRRAFVWSPQRLMRGLIDVWQAFAKHIQSDTTC
jgi:hypothetical protein